MGASWSGAGKNKESPGKVPRLFSNFIAHRRKSVLSQDASFSMLPTVLPAPRVESPEGTQPNSDNLNTQDQSKHRGRTDEGTKNFKSNRGSRLSRAKFSFHGSNLKLVDDPSTLGAKEVTRQSRAIDQRRKASINKGNGRYAAATHEVTISESTAIPDSNPQPPEQLEAQKIDARDRVEEKPLPESLFYERYKITSVLAFDKMTLSRDVRLAEKINPGIGKDPQQVAVKFVPKIRKILGTEGTEEENHKYFLLKKDEIAEMRKKIWKYSKLKHRNLPKFYGFYESDKYFIIVQEYIQRGNMCAMLLKSSEVYRNGIKEGHLRSLIFSIFMAIYYSHKRDETALGRIDISNILLRDFDASFGPREKIDKKRSMDSQGLPMAEGRHTFIPVIVGHKVNPVKINFSALLSMPEFHPALAFVAPEVLRSECHDECAADMYSFGVLVYCLFSGGYLPFQQHQAKPDSLHRIIAERAEFKVKFNQPAWGSISQEAKDMIERLVQLNPKDRLNAEQLLSNEYFNIATNKLMIENIDFGPMAKLLGKMGIQYEDVVVPKPFKESNKDVPVSPEPRLDHVLPTSFRMAQMNEEPSRMAPGLETMANDPRPQSVSEEPALYAFGKRKIYDEPNDDFHLRSMLDSFDEDRRSQKLLWSDDFNSSTKFYREIHRRTQASDRNLVNSVRSERDIVRAMDMDSVDDASGL